MEAEPNVVPRTLEEWMEHYDYLVRHVIRKYIPESLGEADDLSQEIWRQFYEGHGGRSYVEIFDPKLSSPKTFLWEFTALRCLQFLSRSKRTPTARAYSIQSQPSEEFTVGIVDPETTEELAFDESDELEFSDLMERATRAVHREKIRGRRDLRWVWKLICMQYRQDQIAKEMGLSEGTISICMDLIRQVPEVKELRRWAVEKGMLFEDPALRN